MFKALKSRLQQGYRTVGFPHKDPVLPDRFRGRPKCDVSKCPKDCHICADACPTGAISVAQGRPQIDLGKCLFCGSCADACNQKAISFSKEYRLSARTKQELIISDSEIKLAAALDAKARKLFGRSLKLRQVSAGGCNACEADTNVLTTVVYDLGRFGIQFVASPRHADGLLITGPVTQNMVLALKKTYDAVAEPKIVIAVGACAISGGPYIDHRQANNGADNILPVDLYVPGCPPHPVTILDGLLRLLGRINKSS
jgi:Ni,Fe-hydrogenase III small subunit/Pyruvate/2-oxoacid:ferredoxin oxidoreductase delta subunit